MQHFISIEQLDAGQLQALLTKAQDYVEGKVDQLYPAKTLATVFYEPSTRTRCSFEIAANRLQAKTVALDIATSSVKKGESIFDTLLTLQAMGVDVAVIRIGEDNVLLQHAEQLSSMRVVNAGEGCVSHPTQGLLDVLTMQQCGKDLANSRVAIIGDVVHSRVAASQIQALSILGCKDIRLIAPEELLTAEFNNDHVKTTSNLEQGLEDVDVLTVLRLQHERMQQAIDISTYIKQYSLTAERLAVAKPDVIVLHPGPMNREVEISNEVADGPHSKILQQVTNGVVVRMAVLAELFNQIS